MTIYTQYQTIEPGTVLLANGWREIPQSCLDSDRTEQELAQEVFAEHCVQVERYPAPYKEMELHFRGKGGLGAGYRVHWKAEPIFMACKIEK